MKRGGIASGRFFDCTGRRQEKRFCPYEPQNMLETQENGWVRHLAFNRAGLNEMSEVRQLLPRWGVGGNGLLQKRTWISQ
jgi:hypothetical protein